MYRNIFNDKLNGVIFVDDDINGWKQYPASDFHYAYRKSSSGTYTSLYGDKLEKITAFDETDTDLFESDLNIEMRVLLDLYKGNEEVPKGHRIVIYDIETSTEGGFPDINTGDKPITAIALYDYSSDKYYSLILDKENKVQNKISGNEILRAFETEEGLLTNFLTLWRELNPTIITGWNCIPTSSNIWTDSEIKPIIDLREGEGLYEGKLEQFYPASQKQVWNVTLVNGMKLPMSKDHKIHTTSKLNRQYTDFKCKKNLEIADLSPEEILYSKSSREYYVKIPIRKNLAMDYNNINPELFYVMGMLYTNGTFKKYSGTRGDSINATLYNNNLDVIHRCKSIFDRNKKRIRKGDGIKLDERCYNTSVWFTSYNELTALLPFVYDGTKKCLNINLLSKLSYSQFMLFLSGLIDGDGGITDEGHITFCNYINDIPKLQELLLWNGIYSTKNEKNTNLYISKRQLTDIGLHLKLTIQYKKDNLRNVYSNNKCRKSNIINFRLVEDDNCVYIKIKSIEKTDTLVNMIDIKTSTSYFNYSGIQVHNCDFFDNPYIYHRIKNILGKQATYKLSPLGIVYQNQFTKKLVLAGISSLDYIELYKKWCPVMKSSYSLASVSKDEELEHQKLTYKGNLDDLYKQNLEFFISYNLQDVKCIVDLEKKYKFIELCISVCHKGHVQYDNFRMSSRWIDGAILDYLHTSMNVIAPNKPIDGRQNYEEMIKSDEEGFEGAYVKIPQVGLHSDICSIDIQSLYPSIIRTLNISPETKIGNIKKWDWDSYNSGNMKEIQLNDLTYTLEEFKRMISNKTISISNCGTCYTLSKIGVIPAILTQWFEERLEYKKLQKEYNISGDKIKEEYYNLIQNRTKVFLNTCYGILGLPIFRFYDIDNAKSTTLTGQFIIKKSETFINTKFQEKLGSKYRITYEDGTSEIAYQNQPSIKERGIILPP